MKTVIELVFISGIGIGLLAMNFSFGSFASAFMFDNNFGGMPSHPPPPMCSAFPGTAAWNECWNNWRVQMQVFEQEMLNYQKKLTPKQMNSSHTSSSSSSSSSSSVLVNGYSLKSDGLSINSMSENGDIRISIFIGKHKKVAVNKTEKERKITWNVLYPKNVTKWVSLVPPEEVSLSAIKHEVKDDTIQVTGPANEGSSSMVSSFGNFDFGQDFDVNFPFR